LGGATGRGEDAASFVTDIPARLDRLPWSRFQKHVVVALGNPRFHDGLEVTLVGSLAGALTESSGLGLSESAVGLAASAYLAGAILGALGFGYLTDRLGRRRLFLVTLGVYAAATLLTGCAWNFWSFALFRFATGAGIGGEYVAINSAIQELVPARHRGRVDLAVNGSFWVGAALGALGSMLVLDPSLVPPALGWRLAFAIGGLLGIGIAALRRNLPESPRWLMTHGRLPEAERMLSEIEARVRATSGSLPEIPHGARVRFGERQHATLLEIARTVLRRYPRRAILCLTLMASQAFFYNAVFFTYALVLQRFYGVPAGSVGAYILAFAAGNFMGPLLLGPLFDSVGRKPMIAATYGVAGILMAATALLFEHGLLDAASQTAAWTAIFFVASAAASSAYLTVGESFPLEVRAAVIALFYAGGIALGGVAGPAIFGALVESGSREAMMWGYLAGAFLMIAAAGVELAIGVGAERRSLEAVAAPLAMME
jgi:MFS family permease